MVKLIQKMHNKLEYQAKKKIKKTIILLPFHLHILRGNWK